MRARNPEVRLSLDRLRDMEPYEQIVFYELIMLPALRSEGDRGLEAKYTMNLGMAYDAEHRFDEAIHHLNHSCELLEELGEEEFLAQSLVDLGAVQRYTNRSQDAVRTYARALEIAERLAIREVISSSVRNLVILLDEELIDHIPLELYANMEKQALRYRLDAQAADAGRLLGETLLRDGQREEAHKALGRALQLARDLGSPCVAEITELLESGGYSAYRDRLFDEAVQYFAIGQPRLAAKVFDKILAMPGDAAESASSLCPRLKIGLAYLAAELWVPAETHLTAVFNSALTYGGSNVAANAARSLSELHLRLGHLDLAERFAREAIRLFKDDGEPIGEALSRLSLAAACLADGRIREARGEAEYCGEILRTDGSPQALAILQDMTDYR